MSWFKETVGREVKNKIKNKHPVAHEKIIIEIFVFINVSENNINKIFSFLLLRYFFLWPDLNVLFTVYCYYNFKWLYCLCFVWLVGLFACVSNKRHNGRIFSEMHAQFFQMFSGWGGFARRMPILYRKPITVMLLTKLCSMNPRCKGKCSYLELISPPPLTLF